MITQAEFADRRKRLFDKMAPGSVAVVRTAARVERTHDTYYRYRPNSSFYYLTGVDEPDAYAVFTREGELGEYILFSARSDPSRDAWFGARVGQEGAIRRYGADRAFAVEQLDEVMPRLLEGKRRVYYLFGHDELLHRKIGQWIRPSQEKVRRAVISPTELVHLESILQELRLYKSPAEVALLKRAIDITTRAILRAMRAARPGVHEYELEAELLHEFTRSGAQPSFTSVVSAGVGGCLSHYRDGNHHKALDDDLIILDAGAEYGYYTADLTVTFPVNGVFTAEQRNIYELVLDIETSLIAMIRPGVTIGDLERGIPQKILRGLLSLGVISGDLDELLKQETHRTFFMHNMGHWLGMDIHDEASYGMPDGAWRPLLPGMVMTVEPGIYVRRGTPGVDPRWWNIGARIEDNLLVTETGCEVLSSALPRRPDDIEQLMGRPKASGGS